MISFETVILYLTMVTVTINGQTKTLPITTGMSATVTPPDSTNPGTHAFDADFLTAPTTCAATTAVTDSKIIIDLKNKYTVYSITIANKPTITLASGSITTTSNTGLNQAGVDGLSVGLYYLPGTAPGPFTNTGGTTTIGCTITSPGTSSAPFGTITATAVTATFNCKNYASQYIVVTGPGAVGTALCAFTITLTDPTRTTATTTTKEGSRFVRFDWSIVIAMLLAAVKVTMDNGRY